MANFNLMHCIPPTTRVHGAHSYREIISSVQWGLEQLGHQVGYSLNGYHASSTNIVFGAHMLPLDVLKQLPRDTIVYNFEQGRGIDKGNVLPEVSYIAEAFTVWDYNSANMPLWKSLGNASTKLVPVGYAPVLSRIPKAKDQDIEVLFYGSSGQKRLSAIHQLAEAGYRVVFVCGLYGSARDALISRSKIVLNVNRNELSKIFEVVRVSYLLANRKAVVAILEPDMVIEPGFVHCIASTNAADLISTCERLLANDTQRSELEDLGFATFAARSITKILEEALS